ncbi:MAG: NAD(P)/FAD-dependent oxidoreductase [Hyphomicrobiaceae bacterium]
MTTKSGNGPLSFWQARMGAMPEAPPLTGDRRYDVAIIGGGYTGLSAAYHLKAAEPGTSVCVLEAETAGFGASGRNGGFVMTLFGASAGLMKTLHGKERVREAHHYMERSIDALEEMVRTHGIDCDFQRGGFLKVATSPSYVGRIKEEMELFQSLGLDGFVWLERDEVLSRVHSHEFLGACLEPGCGLLDPMKWLAGLRTLAMDSGADVFERSPVVEVRREGGRYHLKTLQGTVSADKIVYATNGYTHLMRGMRSKQLPAFAYIVVTEPLSAEQRASIGWNGGEGIEDARNFMHFYRLTPDGRILAGGGPGLVPFAGNMDNDASPHAWAHLERFITQTFPGLKGIRISHRWGGAFSVTADSTPQVGTLDGGGATFSIGCTGHGVAMTHMNGRIVADLVAGRKTDLTDLWFVNRRVMPLPPEPFRWLAARAVMAAMALDDYWAGRRSAGS